MARPSYRGLRRSAVVAVCVVTAAAGLTGSSAPGQTTQLIRVLQMNLCGSGIASCYTNRAVAEAAAVIRADLPDVVTLNEVCRNDVTALGRALDARRDGTVAWAFQAARDRRTGREFRCRNGQAYGIGLVARVPALRDYTTYGGIYPVQDGNDPEERAWLCLSAIGGFLACTTHLAYTNPAVALRQCDYLFRTAVPFLRAGRGGPAPTVVGGDLNLRPGGTPDVHACVPPGYRRVGDGNVQHVVVTADVAVGSTRLIDMARATDHPGLFVTLTMPPPSPTSRSTS